MFTSNERCFYHFFFQFKPNFINSNHTSVPHTFRGDDLLLFSTRHQSLSFLVPPFFVFLQAKSKIVQSHLVPALRLINVLRHGGRVYFPRI